MCCSFWMADHIFVCLFVGLKYTHIQREEERKEVTAHMEFLIKFIYLYFLKSEWT